MNAELDEIRSHLVRIESAVLSPRTEPLTVTREQAMAMTGHVSKSAFYRWAAENSLFPCAPGQYITKQVTEAVYRAALRAKAAAKKPAATK